MQTRKGCQILVEILARRKFRVIEERLMGTTNQYAVSSASGHDQPQYALRAPVREWGSLALLALFAGALLVYPVLRAFSMLEVGYNEGWNVYNAVVAAHHLPLYGQQYGWTTVN